jgi:16S rRNA (cytosine1402-N4)-methyltransferase
MNQKGGQTAADLINIYSEDELTRVLALYGELKNAKQLARKLIAARPIASTGDLLKALGFADEITPWRKKELTCVFQALRIEVNDELGALREMLTAAKDLLKPGGRIVVLTYHSLEDRIVKNFLRSGNLDGEIEKDFYGNIQTPFRLIEKGRSASAEEVAQNPRARSAKLRVAEKIMQN